MSSATETTWQATLETDAGLAFRIGRRGDEVAAEWIGKAHLRGARDGSTFALEFEPGIDPRLREKIERGSAAMLVRALRGGLALHGSAARLGGGAVVFLGRSGQGKSTIVAELCRRGAELLADDAIHLERAGAAWVVVPTEREHWLDDAALHALGRPTVDAPAKSPASAVAVATSATPLCAFVDLRFADVAAPRLRPLHGMEAAAALVPQVARFILDDPARSRTELDLIHRLTEDVRFFALERASDLAVLAETATEVACVLSSSLGEP